MPLVYLMYITEHDLVLAFFEIRRHWDFFAFYSFHVFLGKEKLFVLK
jgi:hypothetical protein